MTPPVNRFAVLILDDEQLHVLRKLVIAVHHGEAFDFTEDRDTWWRIAEQLAEVSAYRRKRGVPLATDG